MEKSEQEIKTAQTPDLDNRDRQSINMIEQFLKVYEERNRKLDEKFGQVYSIGALLYLLIGMVLVIAGFTVKSFMGVFIFIPIGLSFFVASFCQYSAAKKFFEE